MLKTHFPSIDAEGWASIWYPSRTGEDLDEVHARAAGALSALVQAVERRSAGGADRPVKSILLVSHAATIVAAVRALVGDRELPLRVGTCSVSVLRRKAGDAGKGVGGGWEPRVLADGRHLKDGPSRDWGSAV